MFGCNVPGISFPTKATLGVFTTATPELSIFNQWCYVVGSWQGNYSRDHESLLSVLPVGAD